LSYKCFDLSDLLSEAISSGGKAMVMSRGLLISSCLVLAMWVSTYAQEPRRVTVSTLKGDTIEGIIKAMTATELILQVAGQDLHLPLDTLKVISFVGKIDDSRPAGGSSLSDALKALNELHAASEIGMLRDQYSQKLIETLPRVRAFTKTATGWNDVRLAMEAAIAKYQEPLQDLASWKNAGAAMTAGAKYAAYAEELSRRDGEESHVETQAEREVRLGEVFRGRLGMGDRAMPRELDRSSEGAFNDVLKLTVSTLTQVTIALTCNDICIPHLTLTDEAGRKMEGDAGFSGRSTIKRQLKSGTYLIWAGAMNKGEVGEYTLEWADRQNP
jgi:hypothetical protein